MLIYYFRLELNLELPRTSTAVGTTVGEQVLISVDVKCRLFLLRMSYQLDWHS